MQTVYEPFDRLLETLRPLGEQSLINEIPFVVVGDRAASDKSRHFGLRIRRSERAARSTGWNSFVDRVAAKSADRGGGEPDTDGRKQIPDEQLKPFLADTFAPPKGKRNPTTQPIRSLRDIVTPPAGQDALLDDKQAAKILGVTPGTLAVWRSTGRYSLPFIKVGRRVRYRLSHLLAWLESRTRATGATG